MANPVGLDAYQPVVPSPLNPSRIEIPASPPRAPRGRGRIPARRPNGAISPTERLLRQKAAEAWRWETLSQAAATLRGFGARSVTIDELLEEARAAANGDVAIGTPERSRSPWAEEDDGEKGEELVDFMEDMEADCSRPVRRRSSLFKPFSGRLAGFSLRRAAFALGFMCFCGMLPMLRTHSFHGWSAKRT